MPRAGVRKIDLQFLADTELQDHFENGRFQCAEYYDPDAGNSCLIASIGGRLFRINVDDGNSVQEITISHDTLVTVQFVAPAIGFNVAVTVASTANIFENYQVTIGGYHYLVFSITGPTTMVLKNVDAVPGTVVVVGASVKYWETNPAHMTQAWMWQAEKWMIVQDGQSVPIFYNGATARRAGPNEIKPGKCGTYGMGRNWYALTDERSFRATDLVFGASGTAAEDYRDAVLKETENTFLNGGGDFTTPQNAGGIKGLRFIANLDTSLGQGPLMVCTPNQIFSVQAPLDRTQWQNLENPIQTIALIANGALGQKNTILVNGDLFFRAKDGIRSFKMARAEFGQWSNTPQSQEMNRVLERDDQWLLNYGSAILFDNRIIVTASPAFTNHGVYHRGTVALDLDLLGSMSQKLPPAYDGLETGLNVLQLVTGDFKAGQRAFAFHLTTGNKIELYEITKDEKFDNTDDPISWVIETRSFTFGSPFELKKLEGGDIWIDRLTGTGTFKVYYRSDQNPCWQFWQEWEECATYRDCEAIDPLTGCQTVLNFSEQFRPRMGLAQPNDDIEAVTGRPYRNGYEFQLRLEFTGFFRLKQVRLKALEVQEEPFEGVPL